MAVVIPIITQFSGKGIERARREFAQLEGFSAKAGFILKKSMLPAAAAVGAVGAAAFQAGQAMLGMAQAAAEDQAAQRRLAISIRSATKATDAQIAGVEEFIDQTQKAVGVADDQLRPAFGRLVRSTRDLNKAQELLNLALDVSAATGKPLEAVSNALGRAYDGQNTALGRLGLGIDKATLKTASFAEIQEMLNNRFGGAAAQAADTFEGKMARLRIRFDELQETIGTYVMPYLERFIDAASRIMEAIDQRGLAGGIQQLRYEFGQLGKAENFTWIATMYNGVAKVYNALATLTDFAQKNPLFRIGNAISSRLGFDFSADLGRMPTFEQAFGGVAPVVPPAMRQSPSPLDIGAGRVGRQSVPTRQQSGATPMSMTVNVTSADPKAVVDALVKYQRQNGVIPVRTAS